MAKINFNLVKVNQAITTAWDTTVDAVSDELDRTISSDIFEYPRITKRRNGDIAGDPRDILDLGTFLDSKTVARSSDGLRAEFTWNVPYALLIYLGYTTKRGTVVPGRDWITPTIEEVRPDKLFAARLARLL